MNYDLLTPGEPLDRLVVEKVLGYRYRWQVRMYDADGGWSSSCGGLDEKPVSVPRGYCAIEFIEHLLCDSDAFSPSTRIDHAWSVFERLQEIGFSPVIETYVLKMVRCLINKGGERLDFNCPYVPTAPWAICVSALKAVHGL